MAALNRNILSIILAALSFFHSKAQEPFQRTYGGPGNDVGRAIIESASGGYLIVGTTNSFYDPSTDIYLLRLDQDGNYVWGRNIGDPGTIEWGTDLFEDESGNIFIAGYTNNVPSGTYDGMLVKVNANGDVEWKKTFGEDDWDFFQAMAINDPNGIVLVGNSYRDGSQQGWILNLDFDGNLIWEKIIEASGSMALRGVSVCPSGLIGISGSSENIISESSTQLAMILTPEGEINWSRSYPTLGDIETNNCVCREPEGLVIIGTFQDDDETDLYLSNFELSNGDIQWTQHEDFESTVQGNALAIDFYGNIATTGAGLEICCALEDAITLVFNNDGIFLGSPFADVFGGPEKDVFYDIHGTSDKGYIAVGESKSFGNNSQIMVAKVDSLGNSDPINEDFIDLVTSVDDPSDKKTFALFPNPASDKIFIRVEISNEQLESYEIYDALGRLLMEGRFSSFGKELPIYLYNLAPGYYSLRIQSTSGETSRRSFLKN